MLFQNCTYLKRISRTKTHLLGNNMLNKSREGWREGGRVRGSEPQVWSSSDNSVAVFGKTHPFFNYLRDSELACVQHSVDSSQKVASLLLLADALYVCRRRFVCQVNFQAFSVVPVHHF